jgi:beta-mannosidase
MKWFVPVLLILISFTSCQENISSRKKITMEINRNWEFRQFGTDKWYTATVPGTVHTDLINNGLIEDPYYRLNELQVQWIDKADWEYRCSFDAGQDLQGYRNKELVFDGLDTYADVYLNDSLILRADNMFRTWKADCWRFLRPGRNELRMLLKSPTQEGLAKMEAYGLELPAGNDQSERGGMDQKRVSPFVRKAPYHFGWDWGPRLVTSGIWRPVSIQAWDACEIDNVQYRLDKIDSSKASYTAIITTNGSMRCKVPARIYVDGAEVAAGHVKVKKGSGKTEVKFEILNPQLWWPNGSGEQKLYAVRVELGPKESPVDMAEEKIGVRTIRLVRTLDPDGKGESFCFEVNGRPVFAKGANYIPNDVFLTRVAPADYEFIVRSAADANMNMLRVWGGGIYENDLFYDLCDKYGIMIWQDFMFACSMYPGNDEFLESIRQEAIDNVTRLRNHACMALWCGNNEIEVAWAQWDEKRGWGWKQQYKPDERDKIWKAYDTLFHHVLKDISENYSSINYWPSSPSAGKEKLASYATTSGDMHYWGVWHGLDPLENFRTARARFMSEYGFQSFPEYNSVKQYTLPEDWDIESPVMSSHQRSGIGNLRIRQYMEQDYKIPSDFEQFLYVGQLLQAEAIKIAIESHRGDMPYCMGTLYWQINDCWPVASWSGIDYYQRWKALHYFVKKAYEPVIVTISSDSLKMLTCKVVSDLQYRLKGELRMKIVSFSGQETSLGSIPVDIQPNSSTVILQKSEQDILKTSDPSSEVLVAELYRDDKPVYRCLYYFVKPKDMKLADPGLKTEIAETPDSFTVSITAKNLAKNVFLSAESMEGQFSDNYFDILPGETVTVTIPKGLDLQTFTKSLKIIHLR